MPIRAGSTPVVLTNDKHPLGMSVQGQGSFNPQAISGLIGWFDFSDATSLYTDTGRTTLVSADGDRIKGVADKSGTANHLSQATTGPVYKTAIKNGRSVARFALTNNEFLNSPSITPGLNETIFIVANRVNTAAVHHLFDSDNGTTARVMQLRYATGAANFEVIRFGLTTTTGATSAAGTFDVLCWTTLSGASGTRDIYVNGTVSNGTTAQTNLTAVGTTFRIGGPLSGTTYHNGDIAEVLYYDSRLPTTAILLLSAALKTKWATP